MTFSWTRKGEQIVSTCPRCHATETSRFTADIRRWQRSHTALACWRGRNRAVEGSRSDVEAETDHGHPAPTPARPTAGRVRFTQPTEGETR